MTLSDDYTNTTRGPSITDGLHYHEAGEGPPLVLLHGSGPGVSGWSNFAKNLPVFARTFRTIVVDMPGFGASPDRTYDRPYPEIAAGAIVTLLDDLGIEKAHLLGNSMGGWVSLETAALAPERVDRMVLMGPGGLYAPLFGPMASEGARRLQEFLAEPSRQALEAWVDSMVYDRATITPQLLDERWQNATAPRAIERMRAVMASLGLPGKAPLWTRTAEIPHETLVTWGRDDRMLPPDGAFFALRRMPKADLHILGECGHWAQVERKHDFETLATAFLTR
ncbi:alpha/beta fold hydrolase [Nocardia vermiculata]|uniref:Alpha/beta fold hydrolase n=1 Tax=Nocardia vermiculata TaxID=257274 RepID=A0A846Y0M6_9NOCA|nr:alpha/beta fold hydrolase [Nocardia vermiculata]NKY53036.1 alpha/beta fold hydrolase [Nocardia vermiculata]